MPWCFEWLLLSCTELIACCSQNENKFKCPCHGSQYNNEGKGIRGPAPLVRALQVCANWCILAYGLATLEAHLRSERLSNAGGICSQSLALAHCDVINDNVTFSSWCAETFTIVLAPTHTACCPRLKPPVHEPRA